VESARHFVVAGARLQPFKLKVGPLRM